MTNIVKYQHANEIFPNLWLGDVEAAMDKTFLKDKGITCVINCTVTIPFNDLNQVKHRFRIPVKDNMQIDQIYLMYTLLDEAVKIIVDHIGTEQILVHCHAGRQRSVSIILAFLMKCGCMTLHDALETLKSKRIVAGYPQLNFEKALSEYQNHLDELKAKLNLREK